MNLLTSVKVSSVLSTTSGTLGSTGIAVAVSTAGSSGGDSTTKGGFPFASTGLDMSGYDGVVFVGISAGAVAATPCMFAAWSGVSSTSLSTTYTEYPTAHVQSAGASTVFDVVVLDVVRPVKRYINAVLQLGATSEIPLGIIAIQYQSDKRPVTSTSTQYTISGAVTAIGTT